MEIYGNLLKSIENYGKLWKSIEIYGNLWKSMEYYGKRSENSKWRSAKCFWIQLMSDVRSGVPCSTGKALRVLAGWIGKHPVAKSKYCNPLLG
jgi:hypothetical protein